MPPGGRLCSFHPMWPPGLLCELFGAMRKMPGVPRSDQGESSLVSVMKLMFGCDTENELCLLHVIVGFCFRSFLVKDRKTFSYYGQNKK